MPTTPELTACEHCSRQTDVSTMREGVDGRYCSNCVDNYCFNCARCDGLSDQSTIVYIPRGRTEEYCHNCLVELIDNNDIGECDECGDYYHHDLMCSNDMCRNCNGDEEDEGGIRGYPDLKTKELQSDKPGKIVTSPRKWGVELETVFKKSSSMVDLAKEINKGWGFQADGSIRNSKDAIGERELVSPIMSGKAGEDEITKMTEVARKVGFFVNNSCGYHLHLDSPEFKRNPKEDKKERDPNLPDEEVYYIFKAYGDTCQATSLNEIPTQDNGERVPYTTKTRKVETLTPTNKGQSFYLLRDLWYVYLAFDDVFRGMQPPSRRTNSFCKATSQLYSIEQIRELEDFGALERLWYKTDKRNKLSYQIEQVESRKHGKDGSRYVGFNLEPILRYEGKTIEIRYHSPTLNAEKILRWVDLHSTIFDRVAQHNFDEDAINHALETETSVLKKALTMCKIFGVKKETETYIIERLHKFNKLNAKDEDMNDEEVAESEIGRHLQSGPRVNRLTRPVVRQTSNQEWVQQYVREIYSEIQNTGNIPNFAIAEVGLRLGYPANESRELIQFVYQQIRENMRPDTQFTFTRPTVRSNTRHNPSYSSLQYWSASESQVEVDRAGIGDEAITTATQALQNQMNEQIAEASVSLDDIRNSLTRIRRDNNN